jgi:ferredoxin
MTSRLLLDPIRCEAHGLCAELLPERITLDEWGYPMIDDAPLGGQVLVHARRAVATCPTLALALRRNRKTADQVRRR